MPNRLLNKAGLTLAGIGLATGAASTMAWFFARDNLVISADQAMRVAIPLICVVGLTVSNLMLRWMRWHFLLRRCTLAITLRDSYRAYFATLPAIATPYNIGELIRVRLVASRNRNARQAVLLVWMIERSSDVLALLALGSATVSHSLAILFFGACLQAMAAAMISRTRWVNVLSPISTAALSISSAVCIWSLPVIRLWMLTQTAPVE
jgi:hypothetical protein